MEDVERFEIHEYFPFAERAGYGCVPNQVIGVQ